MGAAALGNVNLQDLSLPLRRPGYVSAMAADSTHRNRFRWPLASLLACLSLVVCWPPLSLSSTPTPETRAVQPAWGFAQGEERRERVATFAALEERCAEKVPGDSRQPAPFLRQEDATIRDLLEKVGRNPRDADAWSDLAAAYLCQPSGLTSDSGEANDLFAALWAADKAVTVGRVYPHVAGQFNLALALDRLSLDQLASEAWSTALAHRLPEPWRTWAVERDLEVKLRLQRADQVRTARLRVEMALQRGDVPLPDELRQATAYVRTEVQRALPLALRDLAEAPRSPAAENRFDRLLELAKGFKGRLVDDYSRQVLTQDRRLLFEASPEERRRLVVALEALTRGQIASRRRAFETAEPLLREAATTLRELGSLLALSADLEWLEALQQVRAANQGESDAKDLEASRKEDTARLLQRLRHSGALSAYSGLHARFLWLDGLNIAKRGKLIEGLKSLDAAHGLYRDLEEPQNQAAVDGIRAEILRVLGRFHASWEIRARAIQEATVGADPGWLYNALIGAAKDAHDEGWKPLDQRLNREALRVAELHRIYIRVVEAEIQRARGLLADSSVRPSPAMFEAIRQSLENAGSALENVDRDSTPVVQLTEDLEKTRAELSYLEEPEKALLATWSELDEVSRRSELVAELPLLYARAVQLTLATSRRVESKELATKLRLQALRLSKEGTKEILSQVSDSSRNAVERKAFLKPYRPTAQSLTEFLVERGDSDLALGWILAVFRAEATGWSPRSEEDVVRLRGQLTLQEHEGLLVLQTGQDKLYGWMVTGGEAETTSFQIARSELDPLLSELEGDLATSLGQQRGEMLPTLSAAPLLLSEALFRDLRGRLSGLGKLTILSSEDLRGIPFGALTNPDTGRFLTADLEVQVAVPVGGNSRRSKLEQVYRSTSPALFVGNPYNSDARREGLPDLPYASVEAKEGASRFGSKGLLLIEGDAEKEAVVRALLQVDLVHFGVHAVRGASGTGLLLGSSKEARNEGFLPSDEIGEIPLHLGLVVLSACQTAKPGRPADDLDGLVEAFLAAGSDTVIASLWNVDDEASRLLWRSFYEHLLSGSTPTAALRQAQLAVMSHPNLANPAYWAGFAVYHGDLPMKGE